MNKEKRVNEILDNLIKTGSDIPYLRELKANSLRLLKKDISIEEMLNEIANELKIDTERFLQEKNQYGINFI